MNRILLAIALAAAISSFPAAAADRSAASLASVAPGIVDGATAQRLVAAGARLVDVRTQAEFDAGHLPGAVLVPFDQVASRASELGAKDAPIVLYCRSGRRTGIAAQTLQALGFTRVFDLQAMTNWPAGR